MRPVLEIKPIPPQSAWNMGKLQKSSSCGGWMHCKRKCLAVVVQQCGDPDNAYVVEIHDAK